MPASDAVPSSYADYQHERAELAGGDGTDMVLVNLYHEPVGAPMAYRSAERFFDRLAAGCGFPDVLRHTAATNWVRTGVDLDVVQALLGHASLASTTVYLHEPSGIASDGRCLRGLAARQAARMAPGGATRVAVMTCGS